LIHLFSELFHLPGLVRQLVFSQEGHLPALDTEDILLQVDTGLVSLQHVETEEQVDVSSLGVPTSSMSADVIYFAIKDFEAHLQHAECYG